MRLPVALRVALYPARLAVRLSPLRFGTGSGRGEAAGKRPLTPAFKCPACSYTLRNAAPVSAKYVCPRCSVQLGPRGIAPPSVRRGAM